MILLAAFTPANFTGIAEGRMRYTVVDFTHKELPGSLCWVLVNPVWSSRFFVSNHPNVDIVHQPAWYTL